MPLTAKSWSLNTYTNGTFTDLVTAVSSPVVKSIVIANGANAPIVSIRIVTSGGVTKSTLLQGETLVANTSYVLDLPLIIINPTDKLQIACSLGGASITAFGAE